MAVITHIEYKVICDNCGSDITAWMPELKGKRMAVRIARNDTGLPLIHGRQYCRECENSPSERKVEFDTEGAVRFFKTAKPVDFTNKRHAKQ